MRNNYSPPIAKKGDIIFLGGYFTTIQEVEYDTEFDEYIYWYTNDKGEYVYNTGQFIIGVKV